MDKKIQMKTMAVVLWMIVVFGNTATFFQSCTSPDAVYAEIRAETEPTETRYEYGKIVFKEEDMSEPEEMMEQDGVKYRLISFKKQEVPVEGVLTYMSASIPYELEGQQQPPEKTVVTLFDEKTGGKYERELFFLETEEKQSVWKNTFSFPITVAGFDADVFFLGDVEIPKNAELLEFESEFLRSLELSEQDYHIHSIEWAGEPYERDGIFYRDALATGEKRIRIVEAKYGGQIRTPDTKGYRYVSLYEKVPELTEDNDSVEETVFEETSVEQEISDQEKTFIEKVLSFVREHLTIVTISVLFVAALLGVVWLLIVSGKRKKNNDER